MPLRKSSNPVQTYYKNKAKRESSKRTAQQRIANQKHQLNRIYICDQKQNLESAIWIYYVEAKGSKAQQSIYLYAQQSKRQRINQQKGSEKVSEKLLQSWIKSTELKAAAILSQKHKNWKWLQSESKSTEWTWKRLQSESEKHRMNLKAAAIWIKKAQREKKKGWESCKAANPNQKHTEWTFEKLLRQSESNSSKVMPRHKI